MQDFFYTTVQDLSPRRTNALDEPRNFCKASQHVISFFLVGVWIDEARVGNCGDTHFRGFGSGDTGKRILNN